VRALLGSLFVGLSLGAPAAAVPGVPARPNILLVTLCSVRADHVSSYGYARATTPHLDRLAATAVVFEHAFTQWPHSAPALAALMTATYGHTNGVTRASAGQYLDDAHETLAEILRAHGYRTAAFVSTPALGARANLVQGFETVAETWRVPRPARVATERAAAWLAEEPGRPFFAWVHYHNAHHPYAAPGADPDRFVDDALHDPARRVAVQRNLPLALALPRNFPFKRELLRPSLGGVHPLAYLPERPAELDFYVARYDAGIWGADRMIGDLLASPAVARPTTIVAVVADHGESLGEHGYFFDHGRLPYDSAVRVPMILRAADRLPPARIRAPVATFALAPTLLELAGVAVPGTMEARSLVPVLDGDAPAPLVFTESGYHMDYVLSVRDATWKLIQVPNEMDRRFMTGAEFELYDWIADPAERDDMHARRPEVTARLRAILSAWASPWVARAYRQAGRHFQHYHPGPAAVARSD
jgi:arylsulfatase A-like enzyme